MEKDPRVTWNDIQLHLDGFQGALTILWVWMVGLVCTIVAFTCQEMEAAGNAVMAGGRSACGAVLSVCIKVSTAIHVQVLWLTLWIIQTFSIISTFAANCHGMAYRLRKSLRYISDRWTSAEARLYYTVDHYGRAFCRLLPWLGVPLLAKLVFLSLDTIKTSGIDNWQWQIFWSNVVFAKDVNIVQQRMELAVSAFNETSHTLVDESIVVFYVKSVGNVLQTALEGWKTISMWMTLAADLAQGREPDFKW